MDEAPGRVLDALIDACERNDGAAVDRLAEAFVKHMATLPREPVVEDGQVVYPEEPPSRQYLKHLLPASFQMPAGSLPRAVLEWLDPSDVLVLVAEAFRRRPSLWSPPATRLGCEGLPSPCPRLLCKYHLWVDRFPPKPGQPPEQLPTLHGGGGLPHLCCVLDVVTRLHERRDDELPDDDQPAGRTRDVVVIGEAMGISRETIRLTIINHLAAVKIRLEQMGVDGPLPSLSTWEDGYPEDVEMMTPVKPAGDKPAKPPKGLQALPTGPRRRKTCHQMAAESAKES